MLMDSMKPKPAREFEELDVPQGISSWNSGIVINHVRGLTAVTRGAFDGNSRTVAAL